MQRNLYFSWLLAMLCLSLGKLNAQNLSSELKESVVKTPLEKSFIQIDLGEGNMMYFQEESFFLYTQVKNAQNAGNLFEALRQDLQILKDSLDPKLAYSIVYLEDSTRKPTLSIEEKNSTKQYYEIENGAAKARKATPDEVLIFSRKAGYKLYFRLNNLEEMEKISPFVQAYIEAILQDFETLPKRYRRQQVKLSYKAEGNILKRILDNTPSTDRIELFGGLGVNLIRDKFVPDVDLHARLYLRDIFFIGVTSTVHYLFEAREPRGFQTQSNMFVGGEFGWNLTQNRKKPYYLGLGVEYLVIQEGTFYNPNTLRINVLLNENQSKFKISPQMYYDFDTEDFFWGFKLGKVF